MKIVIASDSFKGSLTADRIGKIAEETIKNKYKDTEVLKIPMADGGEGTLDTIVSANKGEYVKVKVHNPLGKIIYAEYGIFKDYAVIETAKASGLNLVNESERDILHSNTFGLGELLKDAIKRGIKKIYLGIGGSATNDCGIGFLNAMGVIFKDSDNKILEPLPCNFLKIKDIDLTNIINADIDVICDVKNPLLGEYGATKVFGKQKGATEEELLFLEKGIKYFADLSEEKLKKKVRENEGMGAAGGLGFALKLFLNADIKRGIDTVIKILDFNKRIEGASLVITGEGMIDYQSKFGKVPYGVGIACMKQNIPCVAIVGAKGEKYEEMEKFGINKIISLKDDYMTTDYAIKNAERLYVLRLEELIKDKL